MDGEWGARAIGDALVDYVRWSLFGLALAALFVGAGGGAILSAFLHHTLKNWGLWPVVIPGAFWAFFIALVALWASMDGQRRFLFFRPSRTATSVVSS